MFSSLCGVSLWRNKTFSMHMLSRKDQWVTKNHRENKPRFQDQWVAKTMEKTKNKTRFQNQWVAKTIEKTKKTQENQDFRTNG